MKIQRKRIITMLVAGSFLALIAMCALLFYLVIPRPSQKELCEKLDIQEASDCENTTNPYNALNIAFEPGKTRRSEVHNALEEYFVEAHKRPIGGVSETYMVVSSPLNQRFAYFIYDDEDILLSISVND